MMNGSASVTADLRSKCVVRVVGKPRPLFITTVCPLLLLLRSFLLDQRENSKQTEKTMVNVCIAEIHTGAMGGFEVDWAL